MQVPIKSQPQRLDSGRRTFLKVGVVGSALLFLGRWLPEAHAADQAADPTVAFANLTAADTSALTRIIPVMLSGALPQNQEERNAAIGEIVRGVDITIGYQSPSVRDEISALFRLLTKGVMRALVAGVWTTWDKASDQEVREFLASWRNSRLSILRSAYIGLNNLIVGSWYGNPKSWARIGYAGAPNIA
jgi:hypothetical protein